jgi:hypothetical protein
MINLESRWIRQACVSLSIIVLLLASWFGLRTYSSLLLLRSAYHVGLPQSSSIRAWMTLRYVTVTIACQKRS